MAKQLTRWIEEEVREEQVRIARQRELALAGEVVASREDDTVKELILELRKQAAEYSTSFERVHVAVSDDQKSLGESYHRVSVFGGCPAARSTYTDVKHSHGTGRITCSTLEGKTFYFEIGCDDTGRIVIGSSLRGEALEVEHVAEDILKPMVSYVRRGSVSV